MPIPGFEVAEELVGKRLSFDIYRLENKLNSQIKLETTEKSINQIRNIFSQYYEYKPEIRNAVYGGSHLSATIYEDDLNVVSKMLGQNMEFKVCDTVANPWSKNEYETTTITYEEVLDEIGTNIKLHDVSWDDLSSKSVDIEAVIQNNTPSGIEEVDFSVDAFYEFMHNYIKPAVDEGGWRGGNAWLINIGLHELRNGNYQEASYAFDGARIGLTKSTNFNGESPLGSYLDSCLVSLRELCASHNSPKSQSEVETCVSIDDRGFIFIPKFLSKPDLSDQNFRFSSNIWAANALVLVAAVANAMDLPAVSRSEVDPFGKGTTVKNIHFVLKTAQRLFEHDEYDSWKEWSSDKGEWKIPRLDHIDFTNLSPEIVITKIFSEAGFNVRGYGKQALKSGDNNELNISYESLLSKNNCFYIVKLVDGSRLKLDDIEEYISELDKIERNLTILLLSSKGFSGSIIEYAEDTDELDLYYFDINDESVQSVRSSKKYQSRDIDIEENTLERLNDLYEKTDSAKDTQKKGKLLEDLMEDIFEQLIPDTEVIDRNVRTAAEEMDILLENQEITFPWKKFGGPIQVECKNWSRPAGTSVVRSVRDKMESIGEMCETGILVSWEGISDGEPRKNATQRIREYRQDNVKILVLDKHDIQDLIESGDAKRVFNEKYEELITR